jgi:hypothetical protein
MLGIVGPRGGLKTSLRVVLEQLESSDSNFDIRHPLVGAYPASTILV